MGRIFAFECANEDCFEKETFCNTKKIKQISEINRKSVWPFVLIGKGHRGLPKLCSVIGLAPSISDVQFTEHMNLLESIALQLCLENIKSARKEQSV